MSPAVFGLLSVLPLAAAFIIRAVRLRPHIDALAHRRFLRRASLFLGLCAVATTLLRAWAGTMPMPLAWTVLLILPVTGPLLALMKSR